MYEDYDSILMRRRSAALHSSNRSVAPTEEDKPVQHGARQDTVAPAEARVGPGRNTSRAEHRQGGDLRARSIACSEKRNRRFRSQQGTDKPCIRRDRQGCPAHATHGSYLHRHRC